MALDAAMLGAAGNILGGVAGVAGAGLNFASQKDNLAYQKWAQTKSWAREDDAVQRRAADLQAAGLSKPLPLVLRLKPWHLFVLMPHR